MKNKFHPFHLVNLRPWPILRATLAWSITSRITSKFNSNFNLMLLLVIFILLIRTYMWWKDVSRESTLQGFHQTTIINILKIGIILFIISEILFFTAFFWAYYHSIIRPSSEIGQTWPPNIIKTFNPINVPLLNTIILIRSGISVTWSHHAILTNLKKESIFRLSLTCILGIYFTILQIIEYFQAEFSISDSSYGSTFFISTGFHGLHVLIGSSFLITSFYRLIKLNNSPRHIIGFELATWYWHFVDIIWLFLYISIYWWGL